MVDKYTFSLIIFIFKSSPSSKINQTQSEDDLGQVAGKANQTPSTAPSSLITVNANTAVAPQRQSGTGKDDASIASGSSGCGSLTKKKMPVLGGKC